MHEHEMKDYELENKTIFFKHSSLELKKKEKKEIAMLSSANTHLYLRQSCA